MTPHPLIPLVQQWEQHARRVQVLQLAPRALFVLGVSLACALLFATLAGVRAWGVVFFCVGLLHVGAWGVWAWRARRPVQVAAQHWDRVWGLQERVSTALELLNGRITAPPELYERQIEDAVRVANAIHAQERLRVRWRWWDGVLVGAGGACVAIALAWAMTYTLLTVPIAVPAQAVADAQEALTDALTALANDTQLSPEAREGAIETLETRLDALNSDTLDLESAFTVASAAAEELRALGERVQTAQETAPNPLAERILDELQRAEQALSETAQAFQTADAQNTASDEPAGTPAGSQQGEQASQSEGEQSGASSESGRPEEGQGGGEQAGTGEDPAQDGQQGSQSQEGEEAGGNQAGASENADTPQDGEGVGESPAPDDAIVTGDNEQQDGERGNAGSTQSTTNPDGEGEGEFETIFVPSQPPDAPDALADDMQLAGEQGDTPNALLELQLPSEAGQRLPYQQAFGAYVAAATRALDTQTLPIGLRDFIRAYFDRLRP